MINQRQGVLVQPQDRLSEKQVRLIDGMSRELLKNPGLLCYSQEAAELFKKAGAKVEEQGDYTHVQIPASVIDKALDTVPSKFVLGAREPDNKLVLDANEPRVRFGSGSETNVQVKVDFDNGKPVFKRVDGSIERLCEAAHLCDNLENLDFYIRNVNIRDKEVTAENKDVNKYLASLNNITKHVQAGLTSVEALDDVVKMGQMIAGGEKEFEENPLLSFITCVIKSPLQVVDDTAAKLIEISKRRVPVVISSCPMGGATGTFDEFGMVAMINAELLAGIIINQLASPGAPVLYGSVPVRTRLDTLDDMYGAPEFNHYNKDCVQMARHYGVPCYSTAGVGDNSEPGIQTTAEKMLTLSSVPAAGPQYVHYAFGLLERTNVFCAEQAVLDDAHIGMVKKTLKPTTVADERREEVMSTIREVMDSGHKTFVYNLPLPTREDVYVKYPLEAPESEGGALKVAAEKVKDIHAKERRQLPDDLLQQIQKEIPGVLDKTIKS